MSGWTGDEWRWRLGSSGSVPSITVIDGPDQPDPPANARVVPFGFRRALPEACSPVPPPDDAWEGNPS